MNEAKKTKPQTQKLECPDKIHIIFRVIIIIYY